MPKSISPVGQTKVGRLKTSLREQFIRPKEFKLNINEQHINVRYADIWHLYLENLPDTKIKRVTANILKKLQPERDIRIKIADPVHIDDIVRIQQNSGADPNLFLTEEEIKALVNNKQVIIAEATVSRLRVISGAVFISSSHNPDKYSQLKTPSNLKKGEYLYDFWIVVDLLTKINNKPINKSDNGYKVADMLISRSDKYRAKLGKKATIAFSRAGGAFYGIYTEFKQKEESKASFCERINANPAFKAQILLRYILKTRSSKEEKYSHPSADYFLDYVDNFINKLTIVKTESIRKNIAAVRKPSQKNHWNPAEDNNFVRLMGLLLKKFVDEEGFALIDKTLGGLHTRLGASLNKMRLNSREEDHEAAESNIEMSYEEVKNINKTIDKLIKNLASDQ